MPRLNPIRLILIFSVACWAGRFCAAQQLERAAAGADKPDRIEGEEGAWAEMTSLKVTAADKRRSTGETASRIAEGGHIGATRRRIGRGRGLMIKFFAHHPTAANLLMVMMIAAGVLSVGGLRRETFPDALPVEVEVSVLYPGASTAEVEQSIVQRLEEELESVQYVKEMRGVAAISRGTVTLEMTLSSKRHPAERRSVWPTWEW